MESSGLSVCQFVHNPNFTPVIAKHIANNKQTNVVQYSYDKGKGHAIGGTEGEFSYSLPSTLPARYTCSREYHLVQCSVS